MTRTWLSSAVVAGLGVVAACGGNPNGPSSGGVTLEGTVVGGSFGAASVRGRVSERSDNLKLLNDGSRPAVCDDDRHGIRMSRADVDEVNIHAIDRRHELGQGVEPGFALSPVIIRAPVAHELLKLCQLRALRLIRNCFPVGPPGRCNSPAKIGDLLLRDIDPERPNCAVIGGSKVSWQQAEGARGCRDSQNIAPR